MIQWLPCNWVSDYLDLLFTPACFEWNITTNFVIYNRQLLDLFGLPATEVVSPEEWINAKYIVDKEIVQLEIFNMMDCAQKLNCKRRI